MLTCFPFLHHHHHHFFERLSLPLFPFSSFLHSWTVDKMHIVLKFMRNFHASLDSYTSVLSTSILWPACDRLMLRTILEGHISRYSVIVSQAWIYQFRRESWRSLLKHELRWVLILHYIGMYVVRKAKVYRAWWLGSCCAVGK